MKSKPNRVKTVDKPEDELKYLPNQKPPLPPKLEMEAEKFNKFQSTLCFVIFL